MTNQPTYRHALNKKLSIKQSVLILWGNQDKVFGTPSHACQLANNSLIQKNVNVYIVKHAGHVIPKESLVVQYKVAKRFLHFLARI